MGPHADGKSKTSEGPAEKDQTASELPVKTQLRQDPPPCQECVFLEEQERLPLWFVCATVKQYNKAKRAETTTIRCETQAATWERQCGAMKTWKLLANVISAGRSVGLPITDKLV